MIKAQRPAAHARLARVSASAVALVLGSALLAGCGSEYWLPYETPTSDSAQDGSSPGVDVGSVPAPTAEPVEDTTLAVSITELPALWNAVASKNGSDIELPATISADDTFDGSSSAALAFDDSTILLLWDDPAGNLTLVDLEGPVDGELTTSPIVLAAESLMAATLGLSASEAHSFTQGMIATGLAGSGDPGLANQTEDVDGGTATFDLSGGRAHFSVTPS